MTDLSTDTGNAAGPYAATAVAYWSAGWRGVLPLPRQAKGEPPKGWTGAKGAWPSRADLQAWVDGREGLGNLGLRMPPHLIGIDVDQYGNKTGGHTLAALEADLGALPPTWTSSSRDGVSGIRLYRVPEGLKWPGELGDGIEVIQTRHRYIVAAPSVHPEGRPYRWTDPNGVTALPGVVPHVDFIVDLPDAWVAHFTGGQLEEDITRLDLSDRQAVDWLTGAHAAMCDVVKGALGRYMHDLTTGRGSRHGVAQAATARLARLHGEGHHGVPTALAEFKKVWGAALGASRDNTEAVGEWKRLLVGAVQIAAADNPTPGDVDPCDWLANLKDDAPAKLVDIEAALAAPPPAEAADPEAEDGDEAPERASWAPIDLTTYLDGTHVAPSPSLMPRADGVCLLYPGLTHSLHGESESGKSWVAQAEAARVLLEGGTVLYVDFESDAASVVERLLLLAVPADVIAGRFTYIQPEASPATAHELPAWHAMLAGSYDLAVIDGVTDAMGLFGKKIVDNDEISAWGRMFPKRLAARTGAAVVMIDHVTKDKDTRGRFAIGGQAKMAGLTGAGYVVDVIDVLGKGLRGVLELRVAKDRPGTVRGKSGPMRKSDRTQESARFVLDATGDRLTAFLEVPKSLPAEGAERPAFRPTHLMERVSKFLDTAPGASKKAIEADVEGRATVIRMALDALVEDGYVRRETSGQAVRHYPVKPYREYVEDRFEEAP